MKKRKIIGCVDDQGELHQGIQDGGKGDVGAGDWATTLRHSEQKHTNPKKVAVFQAKRLVRIPSRHNAPPITPKATAGTSPVVQWRRTKLWMI